MYSNVSGIVMWVLVVIWRLCVVFGANALCQYMELNTLEVRKHSTSRRSTASLHGLCESTSRFPWTCEHPESVRHAQRFPRPCLRPSKCVPNNSAPRRQAFGKPSASNVVL
jgi:hypothetical protein